MTITTNDDRDEYTASASQTVFNYTFKIYESTDLNVYQTPAGVDFDDSLHLITAYSVSGVGNSSGGTITLNTGATAGDRITIVSAIPSSRTTDYQTNGDFTPSVVNDDFDRVVSLAKQAEGLARRSPKFDESSQGVSEFTLPSPIANTFWRVNATATGLESFTATGAAVTAEVPVTSYAALRALTSANYTDGQVITVTDDHIAGQFVVKTGTVTDNGGTRIVFTDDPNRYLERVEGGVLNIKWFDAAGDGVTDDTSAIQACIDAAESLGFDYVFFPAGRYLISANIQIKSNTVLYGAGYSSIILLSGNNRRAFYADAIENTIITMMMFDGQKPNVGWETTNNYDFGIRLGESATSQSVKNIKILVCAFKDIGLDGVYLQNYSNVIVNSCHFQNCRRWGIVPNAGTYNAEYFSTDDCYFDCDYGGGPVGKEYPLGAIDSEPNSGTLTTLTYKNVRGKRNAVYAVGSAAYTYNATLENVSVLDHFLYVSNSIDVSLKNCSVRGSLGYLLIDTMNDSIATKIKDIDVKFLDTTRSPVRLSNGRDNLMPYDHGFEEYWDLSLSASGTGTSAGLVLREIDGKSVYLRDHQIGPAAGTYTNNRQTLGATITSGDQVVIILEVERTDGNTATGNFFNVTLGADFSRSMKIDQGVSTIMFAYKQVNTEVNPVATFGLSGTAGVQVNVLFRKIKIFVNPEVVNNGSSWTKVKYYRKSVASYSGPTLDAANARQISLSSSGSENVDEITSGYDGQVLSLYGASAGRNYTVRDASVSGTGNIELISNGTYVLTNGTSTNALTLIYDDSTSTWLQSS